MYLGLDIGTSVTKAALFDVDGREIADRSRRTSPRKVPVGWSEVDGDVVWNAVVSVIGELLAETSTPADAIAGIGITGVMVGAWLLDDTGALVRPPILWNDARALELVNDLSAKDPDFLSKVFARSGSTMQLGCTVPVLAWLKENEPESLARARHVLCAKDYVRYRLTGELATDESEAAMAPGSATRRDFDPAQFERLGIPELARLTAPVRRGETLAGHVTHEAAQATGLRAGTPVAIGTGDASACFIGSGCHAPRHAATILGTTCLSGILFDQATYEPKDLGLLFILPGNQWMKAVPNIAGTTVIDWGLETLGREGSDTYETFGTLAGESEAGANGVMFLPYLSASGVIAPVVEPNARAGFFGLAPHHTRADMVRAIYEGMAYAIRDSFTSIGSGVDDIRLSGGGARSEFWSQVIADITGIPVDVPQGAQFGAKGAVLCAMVATGAYATIQEASAATFRSQRRHEPDGKLRAAYEDGYGRFLVARDAALGPLVNLAR